MQNNEAIEFYRKLQAEPRCPFCENSFKSLKALTQHVRCHHQTTLARWLTEVAPNHCLNCGKQIFRPGDVSVTYRVNFCSRSCSSSGEFNPRHGAKWSSETREKIIRARTGCKVSESFRVKMRERLNDPNIQAMMQDAYKKWAIDNKHPHTGKKFSPEVRQAMADGRRRKRQGSWEGKFSLFCRGIRSCLQAVWTRPILERDNFKCCDCGRIGGALSVHHIVHLRDLVQEVFSQNQHLDLMRADDRWKLHDLCMAHPPILDYGNGITLCHPCHRNEHKGNTRHTGLSAVAQNKVA